MESEVVTPSKKRAKIYRGGKIYGIHFFGVFFSIVMQGRGSYRLDPADSIQGHTLFLKAVPFLPTRLKRHFSFSFSEVMVGLFDFLFVRRLSKNIKKADIIKSFG